MSEVIAWQATITLLAKTSDREEAERKIQSILRREGHTLSVNVKLEPIYRRHKA